MPKLTQEQLLEIFNALKKEVKPYEKGNLKPDIDIEGKYSLSAHKPGIFVQGKIRSEAAFVGLILQSGYVGFYYMPIYTDTEDIKPEIPPALLKTLKGKSCFHIKAVDKELLEDVRHAMEVGYAQYKKNGWI
jgi:hypothetical protein